MSPKVAPPAVEFAEGAAETIEEAPRPTMAMAARARRVEVDKSEEGIAWAGRSW
ncbi:hypothetical protein PF005_g27488 [Phytophthora fragariae]|uniref:Uncharacterized protein n=1 Tax=Phytophthora fragariae TaxID=53985 RepID=A0A6A3W3E0_9STRA|nr:hypothetical protein PF003_g14059 [Phytophthora fragariae]KAE8929104.1 hypothetical protein PF009_g20777 [Phytophthora fragariae]KAE8969976.1 hypothetical protein PF011_g26594 [Phytophthora fragariae]KAE9068390.1 hypothetical protein PF010_g27084 [Phytophthora fragariae]KAE9069071.1 hypothetical protein PF007_g27456 [Phytophthora fragariae]